MFEYPILVKYPALACLSFLGLAEREHWWPPDLTSERRLNKQRLSVRFLLRLGILGVVDLNRINLDSCLVQGIVSTILSLCYVARPHALTRRCPFRGWPQGRRNTYPQCSVHCAVCTVIYAVCRVHWYMDSVQSALSILHAVCSVQ